MPKTTTVIYTLRGEDDPAGFEQLRLTVGQLSAYTVGKWHALRQQVQDFMSERIGQYPTAMEPEDWEQYPPEEFGLYEAATRWTRAVAATV